jgi:hypothetical protein
MREQGSAQRSERSFPMNGIEKQAAFYCGHLPDDRSLVPLTVLLSTTLALWLLVYLVVAVADPHQDAAAGRVASVTFIDDRPTAYSPIARDTTTRTFSRCCATADN